MMGDWDGGMAGFGWPLMMLLWIVLIVAVVWALAALFPGRIGQEAAAPERPEETLDRRLARGEIDAASYDALRAKLRSARAERM